MHLINHSLKKVVAIAAASALMFSLFVSGGMVMAAPPSVPVITSPADGTSTTTSPVRIYGTGEVGSEVFVGGGATPASGVVDASGYWTALVNLNSDSTNVLTFVARNSAGEDSASATLTITHVSSTSTPDTTAPDAPVVTFPTFPTSTTTSPITLGGTAEANAEIGISGGLSTVHTTANASGAWNASVGLHASSTNVLVITATDASGNVSAPTSVSVTHVSGATSTPDVTAPSAPVVTFPTSPYSTSTSPVSIFGTAEAGSQVFVSGGATPASGTTNASGHWSALVNLTPDATNTLSLFARDAAGNDSSSTPLVIVHFSSGTTTPDTTAPAAPVITFPTSPYTTSTNTVPVIGTAEAGSVVRVTGGFGPATTTASTGGAWSLTLTLPTGTTTTYRFTATDPSGNTSSSTSLVITQNTTGGTGSSTTATSSPIFTLNGGPNITISICNASTTLGFIDPGFSAVDSAGNSVIASSTGTVDVTTPGTYTLVYSATSGTTTATTTRTVLVQSNCSSNGGGFGTSTSASSAPSSSSGGSSSQNPSSSSSGGTTNTGTPGSTQVLGVTYVPYVPGTTQVLGATYTPGLPTTGAGGDMSRNLLALMLSGGLVILGVVLKRKQA